MKSLTPAKVTLGMLFMVGGLIAAYIAKGLLAVEDRRPEIPLRNIPMALSDLVPGTVITEAHLGTGRIRETEIEPDMLQNNRVIVGRVVKEPIPANSPIRPSHLYGPGERPPLQVTPGMRAVSVSLNNSVAMVSGLFNPGAYVDVHMTPGSLPNDQTTGGGLTLTLFKGVRVLAINRNLSVTGPMSSMGNSVTLELTPQQANIMILARDRGAITLAYNPEGKGDGGVAVSSDDRATLNEILGLKPPETPRPVPPFVTEHYKGSGRSTLQFRDGKRIDGQGFGPAPTGSAPSPAPASPDPDDSPSASNNPDATDLQPVRPRSAGL